MPVDLQLARIAALERELADHRQAMLSAATIEQAKGMLMFRYGVDQDRAFDLLARWSNQHNVKLRLVAATLVHLCGDDDNLMGTDAYPEQQLEEALSSGSFRTEARQAMA